MVASANNDLLVFTISTDEARCDTLRQRGVRVEVLPAQKGRVPIGQVLDKLGEEGILNLLTESGSRLNTALKTGNFVDRSLIFISQMTLGSGAVPAFDGMAPPTCVEDIKTEVQSFANGDKEDLGVFTLLKDPWVIAR
jgi:diaminohydroxyphosphoribosylaminopyrimidine deaminase/5-amino-6-(5-phosphoribosylamino)uracil reductase